MKNEHREQSGCVFISLNKIKSRPSLMLAVRKENINLLLRRKFVSLKFVIHNFIIFGEKFAGFILPNPLTEN